VDYKGEYVLVLEGSDVSKNDAKINELSSMDLDSHYNYYLEKGMTKKDIIKQIAKDRNVKKDEIYKYFLDK
jgi:16S rRNA (cytidine1402-2'-O)-methyltransferase